MKGEYGTNAGLSGTLDLTGQTFHAQVRVHTRSRRVRTHTHHGLSHDQEVQTITGIGGSGSAVGTLNPGVSIGFGSLGSGTGSLTFDRGDSSTETQAIVMTGITVTQGGGDGLPVIQFNWIDTYAG